MSSPALPSGRRGISFTAAVKLGFACGVGMAVVVVGAGVAMTILADAVLGEQPHVARSPDGTRRVVITERTVWFGGTDPPVVLFVVLESTAGEVIGSPRRN